MLASTGLKPMSAALLSSEPRRTSPASVDVGGVEGGVKAGVMGGVGVEASADAEVSYDEISLDVKVGASLGIGLSFEPSISIKPKEIMHNPSAGWASKESGRRRDQSCFSQ